MAQSMTPPWTEAPSAQKPVTAASWLGSLRELRQCFQSVQLAILLLSLLAVGILVGVLVPQQNLVEIAQIKQQFGSAYPTLKALGLFTVFSSPGFLTLEALLFMNLLLGSFRWLKPAWMSATHPTFLAATHIRRIPPFFEVAAKADAATVSPVTMLDEAAEMLRRLGYRIHRPVFSKASTTECYAVKGNWSRLGPVVAHIGILLLLVASTYGAFTSFTAQKIVAPGGTFAMAKPDALMPAMNAPFWQGKLPDWQATVHSFKVTYYADDSGTPQQFFSDLEIKGADGTTLKRETISVNHPLTIGDVSVYQASYRPTGRFFVTVNGQQHTVSPQTQFQGRDVSFLPIGNAQNPDAVLVIFPFLPQQGQGAGQSRVRMFMRDATGFVGAAGPATAPKTMPDNLNLTEGQRGTLGGYEITYEQPELATGLQYKRAPHLPWIYLAFGIIIVGTTMCFFSQRKIWVALEAPPQPSDSPETADPPRLLFHVKTNKARVGFSRELARLSDELARRFTLIDTNRPSADSSATTPSEASIS